MSARPSGRLRLSPHATRAIRALHAARPLRSVALFLHVYALIALAIWLEARVAHPAFTALAIVFIAGRQHSLYLLNHDASHAALFRSPRADALVATALANLPFFHHPEAWSFVMWRRVHRMHHSALFTAGDPNYAGRQARGDTQRTYSTPALLAACARAGLLSMTQLFVGKQDAVSRDGALFVPRQLGHLRALFLPFRHDPEMESERRFKLVFMATALLVVAWMGLLRPFLLLWILPMYSVYPALLHFMDLTEHRWTEPTADVHRNSRSTWLGPWCHLVCDFHRTLHREHHLFPDVPVVDLPRLSRVLCEEGVTSPPLRGWGSLLREVRGGA